MEAKIILTTLIQRFAIQVHEPEKVGMDPGITLRPKGGMPGTIRVMS